MKSKSLSVIVMDEINNLQLFTNLFKEKKLKSEFWWEINKILNSMLTSDFGLGTLHKQKIH